MHDDYEFWTNLSWPAAPNESDLAVFRSLAQGFKILLLGSTKLLLPIATEAWDLCPKYTDAKIIDRDWLTLDQDYDTIISDGAMNFSKELSDELLDLCSKHCKRLVVRSFLRPNWPTKYAKYFPLAEDFKIQPRTLYPNSVYRFYLWDF